MKETTTQLEVLLHIVTRLQSTTFFSHVHTYIIIIYYYILFNEITETAYTFFYLQQDDTYLQWQAKVLVMIRNYFTAS